MSGKLCEVNFGLLTILLHHFLVTDIDPSLEIISQTELVLPRGVLLLEIKLGLMNEFNLDALSDFSLSFSYWCISYVSVLVSYSLFDISLPFPPLGIKFKAFSLFSLNDKHHGKFNLLSRVVK